MNLLFGSLSRPQVAWSRPTSRVEAPRFARNCARSSRRRVASRARSTSVVPAAARRKSGEESEKGSRRCVHAEQRLVSDPAVTTEKRDAHRRKKDADGARTSSSKRKSAASPDGGDGAEAEGRQDSKRWRKKKLSVTIDEADNCFLGEDGKKSGRRLLCLPRTPRGALAVQTKREQYLCDIATWRVYSRRSLRLQGGGAVAWRRAGQARAAQQRGGVHQCAPKLTQHARARVFCSPLSVERHAEFTFDQVVGVGGAPGDTPHGVAAVCNVPSSRPSSVLYSDSLKFDFDEVCTHSRRHPLLVHHQQQRRPPPPSSSSSKAGP